MRGAAPRRLAAFVAAAVVLGLAGCSAARVAKLFGGLLTREDYTIQTERDIAEGAFVGYDILEVARPDPGKGLSLPEGFAEKVARRSADRIYELNRSYPGRAFRAVGNVRPGSEMKVALDPTVLVTGVVVGGPVKQGRPEWLGLRVEFAGMGSRAVLGKALVKTWVKPAAKGPMDQKEWDRVVEALAEGVAAFAGRGFTADVSG